MVFLTVYSFTLSVMHWPDLIIPVILIFFSLICSSKPLGTDVSQVSYLETAAVTPDSRNFSF